MSEYELILVVIRELYYYKLRYGRKKQHCRWYWKSEIWAHANVYRNVAHEDCSYDKSDDLAQ